MCCVIERDHDCKSMTAYKNFTVDYPARIRDLDESFRSIAAGKGLEVSYALMKLAGAFVLPYERVEGTSGAIEVKNRQTIRKNLELDKRFCETSYYSDISQWCLFDVTRFRIHNDEWPRKISQMREPAHRLLRIIRHSIAHSNLLFGGEEHIEHIYLGSLIDENDRQRGWHVIRCNLSELNTLIDSWINNLQKAGARPSVVWTELEVEAA